MLANIINLWILFTCLKWNRQSSLSKETLNSSFIINVHFKTIAISAEHSYRLDVMQVEPVESYWWNICHNQGEPRARRQSGRMKCEIVRGVLLTQYSTFSRTTAVGRTTVAAPLRDPEQHDAYLAGAVICCVPTVNPLIIGLLLCLALMMPLVDRNKRHRIIDTSHSRVCCY